VVVARPWHELARSTASVQQLSRLGWALREPGSGTREAAERWLVEHLGPLKIEFELGSTEAIKRLVAAGAAVACLAREVVAHELGLGVLIELATRLPRATRRLAIVLHRDKHLGRGTEDFVRQCTDELGSRDSGQDSLAAAHLAVR
jgi:DNA-binding transcriptional LysR family regulator